MSASTRPTSQRGLVIQGLEKVTLEQVPVPSIEQPSDVLIKVHISGLCGSDLHNYRQAEEGTGFVLGHEMVGEIIEVGSGVQKWKVGDVVSSPFSTCCGELSTPPLISWTISTNWVS
jgi:threonine dehydrogenase-like Zn-dependent dehydrogenase